MQLRVVTALADALFEESADGVVHDVLAFVAAATPVTRLTLRLALLVVQLSPILLFASVRPLDRLPRPARQAVLMRLEQTGLGLALVAWRTLLLLHFYEDAGALAAVGYSAERKRHLAVVPVPAESGVRLRDVDDAIEEEAEKGAA